MVQGCTVDRATGGRSPGAASGAAAEAKGLALVSSSLAILQAAGGSGWRPGPTAAPLGVARWPEPEPPATADLPRLPRRLQRRLQRPLQLRLHRPLSARVGAVDHRRHQPTPGGATRSRMDAPTPLLPGSLLEYTCRIKLLHPARKVIERHSRGNAVIRGRISLLVGLQQCREFFILGRLNNRAYIRELLRLLWRQDAKTIVTVFYALHLQLTCRIQLWVTAAALFLLKHQTSRTDCTVQSYFCQDSRPGREEAERFQLVQHA
jgi:hypothetical protein